MYEVLLNKVSIFFLLIIFLFLSIFIFIFEFTKKRNEPFSYKFNTDLTSSQTRYYYNGFRRERFIIQPPSHIERSEKYPLVIALHGYTDSKKVFFTPAIIDNEKQQKQFPCFYFAPNNSNKGWENNTDWIRDLILTMLDLYPIDINRIYIIGFSWGGSGSFPFAESLFKDCGIIPAAIVRCAGMSRTSLISPLNEKTSIWYNVGTADSERVLTTALGYYNSNRDETTEEVINEDVIGHFSRETRIISEKKRISYYIGMGHDYVPVFMDSSVLDWLFVQSL
ncbi:MAG: hypothetical protein PQJ59_17045 [Spirochaetales bacterium]|nr:hypothetical protein [Spirochaetales bacterium]